VYPSGSRRCWILLIGHPSLLVSNAFPWGRVNGPAGPAPKPCRSVCAPAGVFLRIFTNGRGICFNRHQRCFSRLRSRALDWYLSRSVHPMRCSRASSPRAWARLRPSGRALHLVLNAPSPSLRGMEGEVSTTPIDQVANCGFLVELLSGGSSGHHAPFDKGRLVVRRLVHKSARVGLLGGAPSRSLGAEGVEALPRWDPPD
jgi:hypothetical protein